MSQDIILKAADQQLFHDGQKLGLGGGTLLNIWNLVGPAALQVILKILQQFGSTPTPTAGVSAFGHVVPSLSLASLKGLLGQVIAANEDKIVSFLSAEEKALLDSAVKALAA